MRSQFYEFSQTPGISGACSNLALISRIDIKTLTIICSKTNMFSIAFGEEFCSLNKCCFKVWNVGKTVFDTPGE